MKSTFAGLIGGLCLGAIGTGTLLWTRLSAEQSRNHALEQTIQDLRHSVKAAEEKIASAEETASRALETQKTELLRLRGEVTQRRGSSETAEKLQGENTRLLAENKELRSRATQADQRAVQADQKAAYVQALAQQQQQQQQNQAGQAAIAQRYGLAPAAALATNGGDVAQDPLAFYRKNPELMKRYFPQLYAEELAKQNAQGAVATPQPGQP